MNNTNFNYDPYTILQIDRGSSLKDVKTAYKTLARIYHPDKGGHPEMFRMIQEAYRAVIKFLGGESGRSHNPQTPQERKQKLAELMRDHQVKQRGKISRENFSPERFNQEFENLRNLQEDYIYDVDLSQANRMNKTFDQLQRERSIMNAEIDQIQPVFNRGMGFDANVFNRIFEQYKQSRDGDGGGGGGGGGSMTFQEPQALISQGNMGFSHATNPHHQVAGLATRDLGRGYATFGGNGEMFQNPQEFDQNNFQDYNQMPDITQVSSMGRDEITRRMSEYRNQQFDAKQSMGRGNITGYGMYGDNLQQQQQPAQIEYHHQDYAQGHQVNQGHQEYQVNQGNQGNQYHSGDQTDLVEIERLRKQLSDMERKVKIQDKLIRKIHKDRRQ